MDQTRRASKTRKNHHHHPILSSPHSHPPTHAHTGPSSHPEQLLPHTLDLLPSVCLGLSSFGLSRPGPSGPGPKGCGRKIGLSGTWPKLATLPADTAILGTVCAPCYALEEVRLVSSQFPQDFFVCVFFLSSASSMHVLGRFQLANISPASSFIFALPPSFGLEAPPPLPMPRP